MILLKFDAESLGSRLADLAWPAPAAFAAACAERLFSGYQHYVQATGDGDVETLRASLSRLWDTLTGGAEPPDYDGLAEMCSALLPDLLTDWSPAGQYAEDAVAAVVYALRCAEAHDPELAVACAQRAYESVDAIMLYELDFDYTRPGDEQAMLAHSLTQAEFQRQERDLADLAATANPEAFSAAIRAVRARAEAEPIH
jgi:uncharacterized protein YjaG (DUF416 family)